MFSYDPTANEVVTITTVNGLLGDEIDALTVTDNFMVIGYSNGVLGIHKLMDDLTPTVQLRETYQLKQKIKPSILFWSMTKRYICHGYGISIYDLSTNRFVDSYFFGVNNSAIQVNQTALVGEFLYAATEEGLYKVIQRSKTRFGKRLEQDRRWTVKSVGLVKNAILGVVQSGSQLFAMG